MTERDSAWEAAPELERLFERARRDGPSAEALGRMARRLAPLVDAGVTVTRGGWLEGGLRAKLWVGVGGCVVLGALGFYAAGRGAPSKSRAPEAPLASAPSSVSTAQTSRAQHVDEGAERSDFGDARPAPVTAPSQGGLPRVPDVARESEIELLSKARRALKREPQEALLRAAEHARRFPTGALVQERELIALQALEALGRREELEARGKRFLARYPRSAHRRQVELLLGEDSFDSAP